MRWSGVPPSIVPDNLWTRFGSRFHRFLGLPGSIVPLVARMKPRNPKLCVDKEGTHSSEGP
jgi:hypothetical protein